MSDNATFQELSSSLTEKERNDLLKRIQKSLHLEDDTGDNVYPKEMTREERNTKIAEDLKHLGVFQRFILWLMSKVTSKSRRELLLDMKVKKIKKEIQKESPGITGFETRNLTPAFAETLFSLWLSTLPLKNLYRTLWGQKAVLEETIKASLEDEIPNRVRSLSDVMDFERLLDIYAESGLKDDLKRELEEELQSYIDSIPAETYANLEKELQPIYFVHELVQFPFMSLFQLFRVVPDPEKPVEKQFFKSASAMLALDHLEKLYYALYTVSKLPDDVVVGANLLKRLVLAMDVMKGAGTETVKESSEEMLEDERIYLTRDFGNVVRRAKESMKKLSLVNVIRYFRKDPYFQLIFYIPHIDLKSFYASILRIRMLQDLDRIYPEIRKKYIERQIDELFSDKKMYNFLHYREYTSIDYKTLGLPFFAHTLSFSLLYNYIIHFYKDWGQDAVQILARGILSQNRIPLERMMTHAAALEDLEDRMIQFDYGLSPDTEEGKLFQRLRFTLASDSSHQRMYRNLVVQKEKEIKEILERGTEALHGLEKLFNEVVTSPSQLVRQSLENHYMVKGKPKVLRTILQDRRDHLSKFRNLMYQVMKLENG